MTGFVTSQTSSGSEVVGDLLVSAFDDQQGDEIPDHIGTTAKSV
jgi:hypothetical protein